tara:strand:- start:168 stop:626 length:459 start_codon:yes stop_codon:yes gene_type:complete
MPLTVIDQPHVLLTHAVDETVTGSGVDNDVPLEFTTTHHNIGGCTVNAAKSRITVPFAGTYLCCSSISGTVNTVATGDGIEFKFLVNGNNPFESNTYPFDTFGINANDEYAFFISLPLVLNASDYVEVAVSNVGSQVSAIINKGYFSVTKLH